MAKVYLGDSVFADFDGYHIVLTTENGLPGDPSNTICLEDQVYIALENYTKQLKVDVKKTIKGGDSQ